MKVWRKARYKVDEGEAEGKYTAKELLVAKGYHGPELQAGSVDIAGCVSRRSSRIQLRFLGALRRWGIRSLDIKNAFPQTDGFDREAPPRAPGEWDSTDIRRIRKLREPAFCRDDSPVAFRRPLHKCLADSAKSPSGAGVHFAASSFDPRLR